MTLIFIISASHTNFIRSISVTGHTSCIDFYIQNKIFLIFAVNANSKGRVGIFLGLL